jgi:hypothetical protein
MGVSAADAIEYGHVGAVDLAVFPAAWLGAYARPNGPGALVPARAGDALAATSAAAVLDGAMFDNCDDASKRRPTEAARYAASRCARPLYGLRDAAAGLDLASAYPARGATLGVDAAGVGFARPGWSAPAGARVAVQGYPALVLDGRNVADNAAGHNGDVDWRAGLALLGDGRMLFAVGRIDMEGLGAALVRAGARAAHYTDGGGSARLATADHDWTGSAEDRPVATWLLARAPAPSAAGPLLALAGASAAGVGLYRWITGGWPW